jgi:hypothetical protein
MFNASGSVDKVRERKKNQAPLSNILGNTYRGCFLIAVILN